MCKCLKVPLLLGVLFVSIFATVYAATQLMSLIHKPLLFEFFLSGTFFALAVALIGITYKVTRKTEVERIKNDLISTVNHELRTPLTAISGAMTIISNNLVGEIPISMKEMMSIVNNNTSKLLDVINKSVNTQCF